MRSFIAPLLGLSVLTALATPMPQDDSGFYGYSYSSNNLAYNSTCTMNYAVLFSMVSINVTTQTLDPRGCGRNLLDNLRGHCGPVTGWDCDPGTGWYQAIFALVLQSDLGCLNRAMADAESQGLNCSLNGWWHGRGSF